MCEKEAAAMESQISMSWWNCVLKGYRWEIGVVTGPLVLSAVLALFGSDLALDADFAGTMRALYLAVWLYILGLVGVVAITVWTLVKTTTHCQVVGDSLAQEKG
jgi:energy-converting hydrogenase Eha subunit B